MARIIKRCKNCRIFFSIKRERCPKCRHKTMDRFYIEYRDRSGRHVESAGNDLGDAQAQLARLTRSLDEETRLTKKQDRPLGKYLDWYLNRPAIKSQRGYRYLNETMGWWIKVLGKNRLISQIMLPDIEDMEVTVKPQTYDMYVWRLSGILRDGVRLGLLKANPLDGYRSRSHSKDTERNVFITKEQFDSIISHLPDWLVLPAKLGYYLGMRQEEIMGLVWSEVDLIDNQIILGGKRVKKTHSNRGKAGRTIPIHPDLVDELYQKNLEDYDVYGDNIRTGLVFRNQNGVKINHVYRHWNRAVAAAGLENIVFHDLRHTAATNMSLNGNAPEVVMDILGHDSLKSFRRYREITPEEKINLKYEGYR